jgi:hypothetical protein
MTWCVSPEMLRYGIGFDIDEYAIDKWRMLSTQRPVSVERHHVRLYDPRPRRLRGGFGSDLLKITSYIWVVVK